MERLEPEVPLPKVLSDESLALQEAESKPGSFVFFRRFFTDGETLKRDDYGELESVLDLTLLESESFTIGRHTDSDIVLDWDPAVSRSHARLSRAGGSWYVDDLSSENGTSVDGDWVGRAKLVDGNQIRMGDTILVFRQVESSQFRETVKAGEVLPPLTYPQQQVLAALAEPMFGTDGARDPATNAEIAGEIHLSIDSVKGHLRHLFKVFDIGSDVPQNRKRRRLAEEAIRRGAVRSRDYS